MLFTRVTYGGTWYPGTQNYFTEEKKEETIYGKTQDDKKGEPMAIDYYRING